MGVLLLLFCLSVLFGTTFYHWNILMIVFGVFLFFFFCLFAISWAAPAAHGGSQARGLIGAVATGLRQSHSNAGSEPRL